MLSLLLAALWSLSVGLRAAAISDVRFIQDAQGLVHVTYRLEAPRGALYEIGLKLSDDGGRTFSLIPTAVTGDVGVVSGAGDKEAVWDVEKDHPELFGEEFVFAVEGRRAASGKGRAGLAEDMASIPAGSFWMGSSEKEGEPNERPRHKVYLDAFQMDKYPVTVAQFRKFGTATGATMLDQPVWNKDDHPVVYVDFDDAQAYCEWAGKRLPTEAQWEKAARGRSEGPYSFGDSETWLPDYGWFSNNAGGQTHPVGQKKPNRYGLYDMHGNVWEWVADWYTEDYYGRSPQKNPPGPEMGESRVLRGGAWSDFSGKCRSAARDSYFPDGRFDYIGFRCAR